ncbi:putative short-subunit dehydrogenase-like oxidoreductase (DUF2520 family) [Microbacterium ginsengiterrae]|uniref:Putative short-subunit dehydrogenase-like oxidoreductase (DUF2520 family) n=1 Tax=Microbacterium ginsengiterrae TaxID=546115 RepID=A0A7W9FD59_9MICO|nr:Rossmann-like and DUF2520 domain-containing protein [Microbacterium ginsengiterrae]MBB5743158.1 putative short-subunit dehydrogenase-like oxidoreductase (DUF2520 family) [Microbacterium ginsengiterrae]
MRRDGRLGVGIIGAGRVGPVIGAALGGAGHAIIGITSGSDDDRVAGVLPDVPVLDAQEVLRRSELVILAVPHDELPGLVSGLVDVGAWQPGQLVLHTDPAFGIGVLEPAQRSGAIPLAVHPAISFTGTSIDLRQLQASFAAVSAPGPVLPIAQALAVELGCEPVVIAEEDRPAYAEAIATASEFSRAIIGQSTSLLRRIGVENPGGYLSALVQSTVETALREESDPPAV